MKPFKTIRKIFLGLLILGLLVGFGCSSSPSDSDDDGGDNGDGDDPTTYELTVQASPAEGGSVDPESGTYDEGEEVEVAASAADGWEFIEWSGDISSSENPLTFTITENTSLTASFEEAQTANAYSNQITLTDGTHSQTLTFGMDEQASDSFDSGIDDEAPPEPPQGSFYSHFIIDGYNLFDDLRPVQGGQTVWEIHFSPESSNTMTLNWDFNSSNHAGTLTLVDDLNNASIQVDMEAESSYEVSDSDLEILYIVQQ